MLKSSIRNSILNTLPDDRPITALQVIENLSKCPFGFYPISRTYDQDQDADLRESSIFKSSSARYLCLSKSEGLPNFVIKEIVVINDKVIPPRGFSLLNRTADTEQKAWKKKQLCYQLVNLKEAKLAVTDIIVCSRLKKAPEGFSFAGELNGITICYKMGNVQDGHSNPSTPNDNNLANRPPRAAPPPPPGGNPMYPNLLNNESDHDYEILLPGYNPTTGPGRPAPKPPAPYPPVSHQNSVHSLGNSTYNVMEGVPFIINPKFMNSSNAKVSFPAIKAKSMQQILREYNYPFTAERQT